jgi:rare lipoprotein A
MRAFLAALSLWLLLPSYVEAAEACKGPACCVVYGVPAVCRSAAVEREAIRIALAKCPACNRSDVADAIYSLQMNRGPYASAADLAFDVLRAMRGKSCPPPLGCWREKERERGKVNRQRGSTLFQGSPAHSDGLASVYAVPGKDRYAGRRSASGERVNPGALVAAHRSLPFGTMVRVTNNRTHKSVVVRIIDRGPFVRGRIIDVTPAGARALGFSGLAPVSIARL